MVLKVSQLKFTSILSQEYSWGHLLISFDDIKAIFIAHNVFSPFADYILAFGFKTCETDENFGGSCVRNVSGIVGTQNGPFFFLGRLSSIRDLF